MLVLKTRPFVTSKLGYFLAEPKLLFKYVYKTEISKLFTAVFPLHKFARPFVTKVVSPVSSRGYIFTLHPIFFVGVSYHFALLVR